MVLDIHAIEHECNAARRKAEEEFPDLSLVFIVYKAGEFARAAQRKKQEILDHPAGSFLWAEIENSEPLRSASFLGLSVLRPRGLMSLTQRKKAIGCLALCADVPRDVEAARLEAWALCWHALREYVKLRDVKGVALPTILAAAIEDNEIARRNMLADGFGALLHEMLGKKNAIATLAGHRAAACFEARRGSDPGDNPFPVIFDAIIAARKDVKEFGFNKARPVREAMEFIEEIEAAYGDGGARQWRAFCAPAQLLAFLGLAPAKILGAAAYGADDPGMRSIAYLLSEILNVDPLALTDEPYYNFFADEESNARRRRKACEDVFETAWSRRETEGSGAFRIMAERSNVRLLQGHVLGWCAPALLATEAALSEKTARQSFISACELFDDACIKKLAVLIANMRRDKNEPSLNDLAENMRKDPVLDPFIYALDTTLMGDA